nr:MATE family efflux transporter [Lachnospiraceae bacterium]
TNFVSLLDNIMVGQIGTEQMSGVAIVNQLLFVYILCIFGGLAGAGIFTAQYYGQKDDEGIRRTFRYKLWMAVILTLAAILIMLFYGSDLIGLYLKGLSDGGDPAAALRYGLEYLKIMMFGLPPFMMVQIYSGTLRECGETVIPMRAGVVAVFVNLVFNYLLIFGHFGFPALGVNGAALATVLSRYVEMGIVVIFSHTHTGSHPYFSGIYSTVLVPFRFVRKFFFTGFPLLINETLWSAGMAILSQCYSLRGLNVVAGYNIASTINNVFNIMLIAMGDAVAIIVGSLLGAGKYEEARDNDNKIIAFTIVSSAAVGLLMFFTAPLFPRLYNTTPEARRIAAHFLMAFAFFMPQIGFLHTAYFTLRSGGKTIITFLFDSLFVWVVSVPLAYVLSRYTDLYVIWIFVALNVAEWSKCLIGFIMVKKGLWINNIVDGI